jgi:hypothetical protein
MSDALNPRARAFLRSVEGGDDPTRADRERVRTRVKAQLAAGIAAGVAALATSKAAASIAPAATGASMGAGATVVVTGTATTATGVAPVAIATAGSGIAIGKLAAVLVIVGAVAGGTTAVVRHVQPGSAPSVPAAVTAATPRPAFAPRAPLPAMPPTPVAEAPVAPAVDDPLGAPVNTPAPPPAAGLPAPARNDRASIGVPPVPLPAPAPVQTTPAVPSLDDEVSLVRDARAALRGGDAGQALALLDEHDRRFPGGALAEDCAAARIYTLCALGRTDAARALASRFLSEHPVSPHAASVRNSCGASGGAN